ncbi:xanthine dehydrogenase family protein molybdopterin-binding subunit [Aquabacter sp. CN5-332]|uniref:xanthine dehydrogenase family protein molybdopterin-binding subunit n=1 Tax=Aquabacter sp. CN5-332 TaxID=3156608 RepID=UPI0032B3374E
MDLSAIAVQTRRRVEDSRFVTGAGRYTGDLRPDGLLHTVFIRSPHARARIVAIDITTAASADGVLAVITGADLCAAGLKPSPGGFNVAHPDGSPAPRTDRPALAIDQVRYVGEAVAAVVARTLAQAIDAAEQVDVQYGFDEAASSMHAAASDPPAVWDDAPDNIAFRWQGGDAAATDAALKAAAHVTRLSMSISRVSAHPMETRNVLAQPQEDGRLLIQASHQSPYTLLDGLAAAGFDKAGLQIRIGDVGGSFGLKVGIIPEAIVVAHAARSLGFPVVWESSRSEAFLADDQARQLEVTGEIGFDETQRIVGLRVGIRAHLGAYLSQKSGWTVNNIGGVAGVYDIPAIHAEISGIFSHTAPTAAYRGAGRPEATYIIESLLDVAARELAVSPVDLRRRNLIPASAMPYKTALVFTYDCGNFEANMDAAEQLADLPGFPARQAEAARRGKLRGIGICNCIEAAGGPFKRIAPDIARVSLLGDGRLRVQSGTMSVGQGFETVFPQLVADLFGVSNDLVDFQQGNTDVLPFGRGNGGSSGLCVGGPALAEAATTLAAKLTDIASERLDVPVEALTLSDGMFRASGGNRTLTLAEIAAKLPVEEDVAAEGMASFKPAEVTFPNGTHICEVEIDPDTGQVAVVAYSAVEDIGRVVHPMLAEGQIHGGIAQGIGQALGERIVYDDGGQLITGSFMDYQMPRAEDLPSFTLKFNEVPTRVNPLGVKGVGEAGTVGALAACMNAINDALARAGAPALDMPATPTRVWQALSTASQS